MLRRAWLGALASLLLLSSCWTVNSSASEERSEEREYPPATDAHRAGRWSMQFQVEDNFQLGSFEGTGLSVTKNTSPTGAWRLGLSYGGNLRKFTVENGGTFPSNDTDERDFASVDLNLLRLKRVHPGRRIGMVLGFGPRVSLSRVHESYARVVDSTSVTATNFRRNLTSLDLVGQVGAEVFVARSLSLHAHYEAFVGYSRSSEEDDRTRILLPSGERSEFRTRRRSSNWSTGSVGVSLGMSVYL